MSFLMILLSFTGFIYTALCGETINGPSSPTQWPSWINSITQQRTKDLASIKYTGEIYTVPEIQWTQSSFIQPQMHGYDAYFYDGVTTHTYTYEKWLNDLKQRYGGIDAFLFWVTYTNIGADDRNQFDLNYAIPGGIKALRAMVDYMHSQDPPIKVLFPYNPWDQGTRYTGMQDYEYMAKFLNDTGADGFNGDTMGSIPEDFYSYSVSKYNHPIALEPEGGGDLQSMNWDTLGWGYWNVNAYKPNVGLWKWYDGRRMTNVCDRWAQNHTNDIQNAFFNGIGFESWENVWGCWNGITPRDGEAVRRVGTILRFFGNRANDPTQQNFTQSLGWLPYIPIIEDRQYWNDLFASAFIVNNGTEKQQILFLIVNRNDVDITGASISFENTFNVKTVNVFDCYHGKELKATSSGNNLVVNIDIEGLGFGAILATMDSRTTNTKLDAYLTQMSTMTQKALSSYSSKWRYLQQNMTQIKPTKLYTSPPDSNMVTIPMGIFNYVNTGVEIEGADYEGVDVQFSWEAHAIKDHGQVMKLDKFYMDKYPVTCSEYSKYLQASNYKPSDTYNYLKNWLHNSSAGTYTYPPGYENKPVTYLSLNEARTYCAYNGKRLPHTYEWQYAAQGNTSYLYPWGNDQKMGVNFPKSQTGRVLPGPETVTAYAGKGDSVFGVSDLIGNVWQYTDEFTDIHTRAVVVMGSANYRPSGSMWYFPVAYQLNQHNKYFLMGDSYERCGTIGFRCAADSVQDTNGPIYNWKGKGNYCRDMSKGTGVLCGMINPQEGLNDLTQTGSVDWMQFGTNLKDNSQFKMIRKQTSNQYIETPVCSYGVATYNNNPSGFYWSDGERDMPELTQEDAPTDGTNGIYLGGGDIKFNVNNLKGGNIYKLRVYVGVYGGDNGDFSASLTVGGQTYTFSDNSLYNSDGTTNASYDLIINLESVSSNETIKLLIDWIVNGNRKGNITLQAITLALNANNNDQ